MTDQNDSAYGEGAVAWDDPATRRAWRRQTGRSLLVVAACAGYWTLFTNASDAVLGQLVWVTVAFFLFTAIRIPMELLAELPNAWRVRRVLRAHPWHTTVNPPHGVSDHPKAQDVRNAWFEVPDPAAPERRLPLVLSSTPSWWRRRMRAEAPPERREQIAVLWWCGVPGERLVIAASRRTEKAPRHLREQYQRNLLVPAEGTPRPDAAVPTPGVSALSHPPTHRAIRRRMGGLLVALFLIWPTLMCLQIAEVVADEGHDRIGLFALPLVLELTLLPFHIGLIVAVRRMAATLTEHSWRLVDCEIRRHGTNQRITVGGLTLALAPRVRLDPRATQLWMAGHPDRRCLISEPGGARPLRAGAMSTADNRIP